MDDDSSRPRSARDLEGERGDDTARTVAGIDGRIFFAVHIPYTRRATMDDRSIKSIARASATRAGATDVTVVSRNALVSIPVSYTHLTLPTILLV